MRKETDGSHEISETNPVWSVVIPLFEAVCPMFSPACGTTQPRQPGNCPEEASAERRVVGAGAKGEGDGVSSLRALRRTAVSAGFAFNGEGTARG